MKSTLQKKLKKSCGHSKTDIKSLCERMLESKSFSEEFDDLFEKNWKKLEFSMKESSIMCFLAIKLMMWRSDSKLRGFWSFKWSKNEWVIRSSDQIREKCIVSLLLAAKITLINWDITYVETTLFTEFLKW